MDPNTAATDSRAAFAVRLAFFATTSTRSAFVIVWYSPPSGRGIEQEKNFQGPLWRASRGNVKNSARPVNISIFSD